MKTDELNAPLKTKKRPHRRPFRLYFVPAIATAAIGVALFASVWVAAIDDPYGGQPVAFAKIEGAESPEDGDEPADTVLATGARPAEKPVDLAARPRPPDTVRKSAQPIAKLVEQSSYGRLPKVSEDGLRPIDAYARPAQAGPFGGKPRIVLIVGGMGVSQTSTNRAIDKLPPDVTFAFAPYGGSLDRWVSRARREGHEVLLQVPMEPFGYPETKPGPHTLLTSARAKENADSLKWALSRMTSYTGVMNYMGGRYLADESAIRPFLTELANRGLMFVDDGANANSKAQAVATKVGASVVTGDIVIDRVRSRRQIAASLQALEKKAKADGIAIGVASAFRVTVDEIAKWNAELEKRGFAIVPASAALTNRQ